MNSFSRWLDRLSPLGFLVWLIFVVHATTACVGVAFAAGTEVLQAVPTSAPLISDAVAAVLLPLIASAIASAFASAFNALLRRMKSKGKRASPLLLFWGAVLNGLALNLDQAKRQAQAATKGPPQ